MKNTRYNKLYEQKSASKEEAAVEVAEIILEEYVPRLIERAVKESYKSLLEKEQEEIIENALGLVENETGRAFPSKKELRKLLCERLTEYFSEQSAVVPCGFVDFRCRILYLFAESIVEEGAKTFFDSREYDEFIELLSMFVNSREIKEEVIHIIWKKDKIYLFNKRGRDVTKKYEKEFLPMAERDSLTSEDLAISAVISASPGKLVLHCPPKSPLKEALEKIFKGKVVICHGCKICEKA